MPAVERRQEAGHHRLVLLQRRPHNWPDRGLLSWPERVKLDTVTTPVTQVADHEDVVNGPEDDPLGWDATQWRTVEENVGRLRQRIFAASRPGDLKKVRNLQKLMLRSRSNALVSVPRVTELNAGRKTAGVDGRVVVSADQKTELVDWAQHQAKPSSPQPVKRVYVPKSNGRHRPLGIPVIADRCLQAVAVNAIQQGPLPRIRPPVGAEATVTRPLCFRTCRRTRLEQVRNGPQGAGQR
jgi:hypothetical protein